MTSAALPFNVATTTTLSLTAGGPWFRLERRLRIDASVRRMIAATVGLTWGVTMLLIAADTLVRPGVSAPLLMHLGGHTRLLIGIPLLIVAERLLEARVATATSRLVRHGVLDAAGAAAWDLVVKRVERWRDARLPELAIALVIIGLTVAGLANALPGDVLRWLAPTLHDLQFQARASPALWWFVLVAQPVFLFLLVRWLWRWSLWALVLARLARLKLRLQSSHPDRAGGLAFLEIPLDAYTLFVLCLGAVLSATWADEIAATGVAAASFASYFLTFIVFALAAAVAPYLALVPSLFRAKRAGEIAFAEFARTYIEAFDTKWIAARGDRDLLGTPDVQSLADLCNSSKVIDEMRFSIVSPRRATRLLIFAVAPLLPLILLQMPATELAQRVLELLL